jgi:hypothetical protein
LTADSITAPGFITTTTNLSIDGIFTSTLGITDNNWARVAAPTAIATATPAMVIDSDGVSNILEIRDGGTAVARFPNGGGLTIVSGGASIAGGVSSSNWIAVAAPTAIATATPAFVVDSAGVSALLEVRDAATPVARVANGGEVWLGSGLDVDGAVTLNSTLNVDGAISSGGSSAVTFTDANGVDVTAGGLAVVGQVDVADWVNLSARTGLVLASGDTITPTGTYQPISSATSVGITGTVAIANGAEAGDLLILRNTNASDTISIDGTGSNVECKTDKTLGAGDTLTLIWGGSDWYCLSLSDNS